MVELYKKILSDIKKEGLYKIERSITSSQSVDISTEMDSSVLNFWAYKSTPPEKSECVIRPQKPTKWEFSKLMDIFLEPF